MKFTKLLLGLVLAQALALASGEKAIAQQRVGSIRQQPQFGVIPGVFVPGTHTTANRDAFLFYLAAQQRAAQQSQRDEFSKSRASSASLSPYHQSLPGGASASTYFGRTQTVKPFDGRGQAAYSDRYKHFFGRRGG